ncbi:MAG: GspMb/PilO family protein [Candidatus Omnitrophota bacterium]
MDFKNKKYAAFTYIPLGTLAVVAVVRFVFGPFQAKLEKLNSEITVQEARLKKGISLIEHADEITQEYGRYASYFAFEGLSDEEIKASIFNELQKIAQKTGLSILDLKPQADIKSDKIAKQYMLSVKAEADMTQLVSFLHDLYNSDLLLSVEKMVLAPKSEGASILSITLTISGFAFNQ